MSEDPTTTGELEETGRRGERRRALRAERERQAQRERPDEPPLPPALARPYATPTGQEAGVLVADALAASSPDPAPDGVHRDVGPSAPPAAEADPGSPLGSETGAATTAHTVPSAADGDAPPPRRSAPSAGPRPFDLPPFALPSDEPASQWSAFTPVIPPEPLRFEEAAHSPWDPKERWTAPVPAPPADSWMAVPGAPVAPDADDAVQPSQAHGEETAWTVPTPESGVSLDSPDRQELQAGEDEPGPLTPPVGWSADLSRVELFRSALEDLERPGGDGLPPQPPQPQEPAVEEAAVEEAAVEEWRPEERPAALLAAEESVVEGLPVEERLAAEPPAQEQLVAEPAAEESAVEELPVEQLPVEQLPVEEPAPDESATGEVPGRGLRREEPQADEPPGLEPRTDEALVVEPPAEEEEAQPAEGAVGEPHPDRADEETPAADGASGGSPYTHPRRSLSELLGGPSVGHPDQRLRPAADVPDAVRVDDVAAHALADPAGNDEAPDGTAHVEAADGTAHVGAPDDEVPQAALPPGGVAHPAPPPVPPPPASLPPAPPRRPDVDASLPPLGRQAFGRAPTQRLAEALAHGEGHETHDDEVPSRGTLGPVLRRSTERVHYPTSTMPVIRPPVMPPTPGSGIPITPSRARVVPWEQALAGDVVPQGKKKNKPPRRPRVSKPRHESGGFGEYRPKVSADRSLTLLVVAMLLLLAGLVAAAAWTFWPRISGAPSSSQALAAPRAASGP